ncbi:MAG: hypothetical protein ACK6D6_17400 [Planctomyces sp.]
MSEIQFPFFITRRHVLNSLLFTLLSCHCPLANACDEVLGLCLKTWGPSGGALVTDVTGTAAANLFREGDQTRYKLIAGQHVIKAVNGNPVATKEECVEALRQAAGGPISIDVLNLERGTTRTYSTEDTPDNNSSAASSTAATDDKKYITDPSTGELRPAPGYAWVSSRDHSRGVRWKAGMKHPNHRGALSSRRENQWHLASGYQWISSTPGDLRTRYVGVQIDSADTTGSTWNTPADSDDSDTSYLQNIGSRLEQDRFNLNYSRNRDHQSVYDN